jgi:hypothetical protein
MIKTPDQVLNVDAQELVQRIAELACADLFQAYGVDLINAPPDPSQDERITLASIIGFSGPGLRASCILASTAGPIRESAPKGGTQRDWIAELSNQLVGRIKNKLVGFGAEVYLTTPVVIRGEHVAPIENHESSAHVFAAKGGRVFLWVDTEIDAELKLYARVPDASMGEGEALLF